VSIAGSNATRSAKLRVATVLTDIIVVSSC